MQSKKVSDNEDSARSPSPACPFDERRCFGDATELKIYKLVIIGNAYNLSAFEKQIITKKFGDYPMIEIFEDEYYKRDTILNYIEYALENFNPYYVVFNLPDSIANSLVTELSQLEPRIVKFYVVKEFREKKLYESGFLSWVLKKLIALKA